MSFSLFLSFVVFVLFFLALVGPSMFASWRAFLQKTPAQYVLWQLLLAHFCRALFFQSSPWYDASFFFGFLVFVMLLFFCFASFAPLCSVPSVACLPVPSSQDLCIGEKALKLRGLLKLNYPMRHGIVTEGNWGDQQRLWQYAFEQLKVVPDQVGGCRALIQHQPSIRSPFLFFCLSLFTDHRSFNPLLPVLLVSVLPDLFFFSLLLMSLPFLLLCSLLFFNFLCHWLSLLSPTTGVFVSSFLLSALSFSSFLFYFLSSHSASCSIDWASSQPSLEPRQNSRNIFWDL